MNRATRRETVFTDDDSCLLFLSLLAELPEKFNLRVHGYAIMPNHFHLLLESRRGNLSDGMQFVVGQFTQRINRRRGWDGPLFRGRYHNRVVSDDAYWMHLLAYLHLNPVRAFLVPTVDQARWTSHADYLADAHVASEWLTRSELLGLFGSVRGYRAYLDAVIMGQRTAPEGFDPSRLWTAVSTGRAEEPDALPDAPPSATPEEALQEVCHVAGVTRDALVHAKRGRGGHPVSWLAAWWLQRRAFAKTARIAAVLQVSTSRASQLVRIFAGRRRAMPELDAWATQLETVAQSREAEGTGKKS